MEPRDRAGTLHIWDLSSAKQLRAIADPFDSPRLASWGAEASISPDGSRLVHTRLEKDIQIWDATSGKLVGRLPEVKLVARPQALGSSIKGMSGAAYTGGDYDYVHDRFRFGPGWK